MGGCCSSKKENIEKPENLLNKVKYNNLLNENKEINHMDSNKYSSLNINIGFFSRDIDLDIYSNYTIINNLNGILKLCFIKYISSIIKVEQLIKNENQNLKTILQKLNCDLELINKDGIIKNEEFLSKDIQTILKQKKGNNILEYSKYVNSIIKSKEIEDLIKVMEKEQRQKIFGFLNNLIKYEEYNNFFEEEFTKAQKESLFDYSIVSIALLDNNNMEIYEKAKKNCPNCNTKILFHGAQIDPISNIISSEFKYTRRAFYGMGIYFTDNIEYTSFYSGGENFDKRRENYNKILPPNSTFTFLSAEIFYNKNLLKHIRSKDYFVDDLDHFPTYEEIKKNYPDKMVQKNGIHFITVRTEHGNYLENSLISKNERQKGKFIANEYVITELEQIFKLYAIKLKKNEFFVLWRDPNFEGKNIYSDYLKQRELFANEIAQMNIYAEANTEKALKFIHKKRFSKIILITSVSLDLSGKKFIEIARKILGSNIIILVFSNNKKHLDWIQKTPNLLYTNDGAIYQDYITNYNKESLQKLKYIVEAKYNIKLLDFTEEFLFYPLYKYSGKYSDIIYSEISPYIREVYIRNKYLNLILIMNKNGNFEIVNDIKVAFTWDITLINNELTLFSNGYYLVLDENKDIIKGDKYMKTWNFEKVNEFYLIKPIKKYNNLMLSLNNNTLSLSNVNNNSYFEFIDKV